MGKENGKIVAVELTPQIPGQLDAYGDIAPERKILKLAEITSA